MSTLPTEFLGRPLPADYLAFASGLSDRLQAYEYAAEPDVNDSGDKRILDIDLYPPSTLLEPAWAKSTVPLYARLAHADYFKAIETRAGEPAITQEEVASGFVIGWANEGTLFINLHDGSIWIAYRDWFCEKLADSFAQLKSSLTLLD